jgi:hypothetical protein
MQPRRSLRLVAGALVLALPLLSSCGFGKATDRVYTPGAGTNDRNGVVKVLAAVVVAAQPDSGTFMASLANDSPKDDAELTGVVGSGEWSDLTVADLDSPITIDARGFVNLTDEGGIKVSGDFGAGDFVELTLNFDSGDSVTMDVPVVYACDEYTGLDTSASSGASASESPTDGSSVSASPEATEGTTPSPSETASEAATPAPTQEPYDCGSVLGEN